MTNLERATQEHTAWSVTWSEWEWLARFTRRFEKPRVLEFGPGASTWAFVEGGATVVSVEHDKAWARGEQHLMLDEAWQELPGQRFTFAFVDGPPGHLTRYARIDSCLFALEITDTLVLHDTKREGEKRTLEVLRRLGVREVEAFNELKGITVIRNHI